MILAVRVCMCRLQFGLSPGELQVLSSCLSPVVHDGLEVGQPGCLLLWVLGGSRMFLILLPAAAPCPPCDHKGGMGGGD